MPKPTDSVPAAEQEFTYTLQSLTCRILPGLQAREYIVKSSANAVSLLDVFLWSIALYLAKVTITPSCGSAPPPFTTPTRIVSALHIRRHCRPDMAAAQAQIGATRYVAAIVARPVC